MAGPMSMMGIPAGRLGDSAVLAADRTKAVSFTTEAGLFEEAGVPAVICGPGNIADAHAADEYVPVAQLEACLAFLDGLAGRLA